MKRRRPRPRKQRPAGGGPIAEQTKGSTNGFNASAVSRTTQVGDAIPDKDVPASRTGQLVTGELREQLPDGSERAGEPKTRAISDDEHEAACAKSRELLYQVDGKNPETWRRMIRVTHEPGLPDPVEIAREAATTPRGNIYDRADGHGGGGAFFRAQLPGAWRYYIEHNFEVMLVGGLREPSMMIRHVAHQARVCAQLYADTRQGHELHMVANLFEQYPAQAVDYAEEWAAHFDKRAGSAR
jgi:hypothetical protein